MWSLIHLFGNHSLCNQKCNSVLRIVAVATPQQTLLHSLLLSSYRGPVQVPSSECCNAEAEDCCHAGTPEQALVIIVDSGGLRRPDPGLRYTWPSADSGTHLLADNLLLHHCGTAGDMLLFGKYRVGLIIIVHCISPCSPCTDGKCKIALHDKLLQTDCCHALLHGKMYHCCMIVFWHRWWHVIVWLTLDWSVSELAEHCIVVGPPPEVSPCEHHSGVHGWPCPALATGEWCPTLWFHAMETSIKFFCPIQRLKIIYFEISRFHCLYC